MKLRTVLLPMVLASVVVACGSIRPLQDLTCPCDTGFVCCDDVCVAGDACAVMFFPGSETCDAAGGSCGELKSGFAEGGASTPNCSALTACCPKLPSVDQTTCASEVAAGNDINCASTLSSAGTLCDGERDAAEDSNSSQADGGFPDDASNPGTPGSAYCYYASDAGGYDCSYENDMPESMAFECGCTGTQGNTATAAQTELDCMSGGGSIVPACPSVGLVGCCTSSYGDFAGLPPYPEGNTVACSYGVDMQYELNCVAFGGSWSKTAPN